MSTLIGLATGNGTVSQESADAASEVAEEIAGEGMVLLKNDGMLPLTQQKNLNLFGWASINPVYGGAGSGSINDLWPIVSLEEGLQNAGFTLNTELQTSTRPTPPAGPRCPNPSRPGPCRNPPRTCTPTR